MSTVERVGPVRLHGLLVEAAGISAQGPRQDNEDAFLVRGFERTGLVVVADGMGGESHGRLAAQTAVATLARAAAERPVASLEAARHLVRAADAAVAQVAAGGAAGPGRRMGCALALLSLSAGRGGELGFVTAHVGDVRVVSRGADGTVRLETRDHTPAYDRWEAGEIGFDQIPDTPGANRLQRAVGLGGEPDAGWIPARPGWSYLLVSDGVTKAMRLDELGAALALPPAQAVEGIARKVEERGPDDNYTAVVVRVADESDTATIPHPAAAAGAAAPTASNPRVFDPPPAVTRTQRTSPLAWIALLLALASAGAAGWALLAQRRADAAPRATAAQVDSLRARLDSLSARVPPDTARADSAGALRTDEQVPAPNPATPR